jgi:SAM-dependent methyltransferase
MISKIESLFTTSPRIAAAANRCLAAVSFRGSKSYWERRYANGRNSGAGSYGRLAKFKAEFLNSLIPRYDIKSVLEFGCGDGHQLTLGNYPRYMGLDVSRTAIQLCRTTFAGDDTKSFRLFDPIAFVDRDRWLHADLALSLDVIYHLVEDKVFHAYMTHLFRAADRFVVIYSSNEDLRPVSPHVRHREFVRWVAEHQSDWQLVEHLPNRYPFDPRQQKETSRAEFFVFKRNTPIAHSAE